MYRFPSRHESQYSLFASNAVTFFQLKAGHLGVLGVPARNIVASESVPELVDVKVLPAMENPHKWWIAVSHVELGFLPLAAISFFVERAMAISDQVK